MTSNRDFDQNWHFALADDPDAYHREYDDSAWRCLHLPHDWSIEFPYDQETGDGATGYLPGGIGWYRKHFVADRSADQLVFVVFDGVYNHCDLWCNGEPLGRNPYGYSPFWFDLTPLLVPGDEEQVLAVRVDHSRYVDSRWYTGSGIYRNVDLVYKSKLHIPIWGTRVTTTEVSASSATVKIEVSLANAFAVPRNGTVRTVFLDPRGQEVAAAEGAFALDGGQETRCTQAVVVPSPDLWSPDHPHLYRAVTTLQSGNELVETYETTFGLRQCVFDPDKGFLLNGENTLIKGVCLHHDGGLVGAAVPDGVWRRRLAALKELGCNAIRTAHNPASKAFLDLCDEKGFLVQEEFFDEWDCPKDKRLNMHERHDDEVSRGYAEDFQDWAESDLKRTVQRDWNHPCIFQWSIGNEIEWAYTRYAKATGYFDEDYTGESFFWVAPPYSFSEIQDRLDALPEGEYTLTKTAHKLARWTREMDITRPVVSNCVLPSVSHVSGFTDALDVIGYSYRQVIYDLGHRSYPDKAILGTENLGQWHEWKHVIERPFISGMFIWTGISYLGEAHDRWPHKGAQAGLLDFAGFKRGSGKMFQALWRDDPVIHLNTQLVDDSPYCLDEQGAVVEKTPGGWKRRLWHWHKVNEHWNYGDGAQTVVEVYTNCDEVELFLNGQSLGCQKLSDQEDRILKWAVPFAPGTLEARGTCGDGHKVETCLSTAGEPAAIQLCTDQESLAADGCDVGHVVAQWVDADGVPVRHVEREIAFAVQGPCRVLGVDNGDGQTVEAHQADRLVTSQGRALMIVQSEYTAGQVTVTATSGDVSSDTIEIEIHT